MTNFFQSGECLDFYGTLDFVKPFCVEVEKARIVGYIQKDGGPLKRFLSRRAIVNGGPMLSDDITPEEIESLLNKCRKELKGKAIYVETRNFADYSRYREVFEKCGWKYEPHYNFQIDTSSVETMEQNLGKSRKRDIRTSLRDGAEMVEAQSVDDVRQLYAILLRLYKTKVKTPLFPLSFFEALYNSSFGKFLLVRYEGKVIGGTVCALGEGVVYEWFACGEDGVYKNIYPSTLATYSGMKYAAENGYKVFDMMGAGAPGDGGYGVRDFKAKFGGKMVEHGRFKLVLDKPLYALGTLAVKILKKI